MATDGRRKPRRSVPGMAEVTDTMTGDVVGHVGNLSQGGMLLIANRRLTPDGLFQLRFALPDESCALVTVELGAHVLWQDAHAAPGQHWVGLRFIGVSAQSAQQLANWTQAVTARD